MIQSNRSHYLLNSKMEFNRCAIPRIALKMREREIRERKKDLDNEILDEKEKEIQLEIKIRNMKKLMSRKRAPRRPQADQTSRKRQKLDRETDFCMEITGMRERREKLERDRIEEKKRQQQERKDDLNQPNSKRRCSEDIRSFLYSTNCTTSTDDDDIETLYHPPPTKPVAHHDIRNFLFKNKVDGTVLTNDQFSRMLGVKVSTTYDPCMGVITERKSDGTTAANNQQHEENRMNMDFGTVLTNNQFTRVLGMKVSATNDLCKGNISRGKYVGTAVANNPVITENGIDKRICNSVPGMKVSTNPCSGDNIMEKNDGTVLPNDLLLVKITRLTVKSTPFSDKCAWIESFDNIWYL